MRLRVRPIDSWPEERNARPKRSNFSASWQATVDLLTRELRMLDARNPVIQVAVDEHEIRQDGTMPLASARPRHPGVIVAFDSKHGPLKYVADRFDDWQDNVRAIALGLDSLRRVDRYGITKRGEQYTGWRALPAGRPMGPAMTVEDAARYVAKHAGTPVEPHHLHNASAIDIAYRRAAKKLHPDRGGDPDDFRRLREAYDLLREHTP